MGGSAALGAGDDSQHHGFIQRAFQNLNQDGGNFMIDNEAVSGMLVQSGTTRLEEYLKKDHPNIVVLGYGLLNDISEKTPEVTIEASIREQILLARRFYAKVFVVTSAPTVTSLSNWKNIFEQYSQCEITVATHFHNPDVQVIDLFDEVKTYITNNHIDYQTQLKSDDWHPNPLGHEIAASILSQNLRPYVQH